MPRSSRVRHLVNLLKNNSSGDRAARQKLVDSYAGFIRSFISRIKIKSGFDLSDEDLFQDGVVGLLLAANDKNQWQRFSDYAQKMICREITRAAEKEIAAIEGQHQLEIDFQLYRDRKARLKNKLGRSPTNKEIADSTGIDESKVAQLERFYKVAHNYEYA